MNDKRSSRRGDWKKTGSEAGSNNDRLVKIVFTGMLILGILAFLVYWNWPSPDAKTEVFVLAIGANADMPGIPFQQNDIEAIAECFGDRSETASFDDAKSFQASLEQIVESASQKLSSIDTAMLYVSGHGYCVKHAESPRAALLTTDFKPGQTEISLDQNGAVSVSSLINAMAKIDVNTKVIFLDAGHYYQNPREGVFVNDYVFALHEELKQLENDNIWVVASASLLELPLYSTSSKRTLFSSAVESSLSSKFAESVYRDGQSVSGLYESIFTYTKMHGGDSAPTPLLFRVGIGLVDNAESTPEVNSTIAFYPRAVSSDPEDVAGGDEGDVDGEASIDQESAVPKDLVNQDGVKIPADDAGAESNQNTSPTIVNNNDPLEKWVLAQVSKSVSFTTESGSQLHGTESKIRNSFSSFFAARYRIREYFQVYEAISLFPLKAGDDLHAKIVDFSYELARSGKVFELKPYEIGEKVADRFSKQIVALTDSENKTRAAIQDVVEALQSLTLYEAESAFDLLRSCDLFRDSGTPPNRKLTPILIGDVPEHVGADKQQSYGFAWPIRDPWRTETTNWQRLSNRLSLLETIANHYVVDDSGRSQTSGRLLIPESRGDINAKIFEEIRKVGETVSEGIKRDFGDEVFSQFIIERGHPRIRPFQECFFPESNKSGELLGKLSLLIPKVEEFVAINTLPESLVVERDGSVLRMNLQARGDGLDQVKIEYSFVDSDAPFKLSDGVVQTVPLGTSDSFDHEVSISSLREVLAASEKSEFEMTVRVTGRDRQSIKKVKLQLPSPNRIDIAVARVGKLDEQLVVDSNRLPSKDPVLRFQVYPNRIDSFRLKLINRFHSAKNVRVSLFPCAIQPGKILPERINNLIRAETLDGVRNGTIKELLAAKLDLKKKMTSGQAVTFLSPSDPKLTGDSKKAGEIAESGATKTPAAVPNQLATAGINNGFLCRVVDLGDPESSWDYWFEVFPFDPNYIDVTPRLEGGRLSVRFRRKGGAPAPDSIKLNWALINQDGEKLLIDNDFLVLENDPQEVTLIENASANLLRNTRLLVHVDDWPRKFIFDFDSVAFRRKNDLREVRVIEVSPERVAVKAADAKPPILKMLPLPSADNVAQFGVQITDVIRRPRLLNAHIEVDTSVIEHFGLNSRSEVRLSPGTSPNSVWRLNYPRAIATTAKQTKTGDFTIFSKVTDFENLPIHVGGFQVNVKPELRLELTRDSLSRFPQKEQRIIFDSQKPKIENFTILKESLRIGEKPKLVIKVTDNGVGIDEMNGLQFFLGKEPITTTEGLKPVKAPKLRRDGDVFEYEFSAVKEAGELYIAARVQDRVGNSVSSVTEFPKKDFSLTVLPAKVGGGGKKMAASPKVGDLYDLTVKVVVSSEKFNPIFHKKPKVSIVPADAVGVPAGDSYVFSGLKKGVKYVITGEVTVRIGKATGTTVSEFPSVAKGKKRTVELKLEL